MPKLEYAAPSVLGKVRGAQRSVRYIPTEEWKDTKALGKAVVALGENVSEFLKETAELADEQNQAEYNKALQEAEVQATLLQNKELEKSTGFAAQGFAQRMKDGYSSIEQEALKKVSLNYQDRFKEAWSKRTHQWQLREITHEARTLHKANGDALVQTAENDLAQFEGAVSPEERKVWYDTAGRSFDDMYRHKYGRVINDTSIEAFESDYDNDDGHITLADGRTLDIVETDEELAEGKITRNQVESVLESMKKQAEAYKNSRNDFFGKAHAATVDRYLKADDVAGAESYLEALRGGKYSASPDTVSRLESVVGIKRKALTDRNVGRQAVLDAVAASKTEYPQYNSTQMEHAVLQSISKLKDPRQKAEAEHFWAEQKRLKAAQLAKDTELAYLAVFQTKGPDGKPVRRSLSEVSTKISELPEGPVKREMTKLFNAQIAAAEADRKQADGVLRSDPLYQARAAAALSKFSRELEMGFYVDENGTEVPLSDPNNVKIRIIGMGLASKERNIASQMYANSRDFVKVDEVEDLFADEFGEELTLSDAAPWVALVQKQLEEARGGQQFKSRTERNKWLKENFDKFLKMYIGRKAWWGIDNERLRSYIKDDAGMKREYVFEYGYMEDVRKWKASAGSSGARRTFSNPKEATQRFLEGGGSIKGKNFYLGKQK
jgi:hypothetical protein